MNYIAERAWRNLVNSWKRDAQHYSAALTAVRNILRETLDVNSQFYYGHRDAGALLRHIENMATNFLEFNPDHCQNCGGYHDGFTSCEESDATRNA